METEGDQYFFSFSVHMKNQAGSQGALDPISMRDTNIVELKHNNVSTKQILQEKYNISLNIMLTPKKKLSKVSCKIRFVSISLFIVI